MNREIIEEVLRDEYEIIMASNGSDALVLAQRYQPRIVLLDIMLPGIDGYDICCKLRRKPYLPNVRIIMISAKAMPSERAKGFECGADAYITKPFDEADLLAAVRAGDANGGSKLTFEKSAFAQ
jgi:two-component system alkaline phosphatase synthesis response regulator PhoP